MNLEREIELLKQKLELLERIKKVQDELGMARQIYIPYIPSPYYPIYPFPQPYVNPWTWSTLAGYSGTFNYEAS